MNNLEKLIAAIRKEARVQHIEYRLADNCTDERTARGIELALHRIADSLETE